MPKVPRKGLRMQDLACCDYFRTPVIFDGPGNLVFVGATAGFDTLKILVIPMRYKGSRQSTWWMI